MSEFSDIGSIKALLDDARSRIKEAEDRSSKKIEEVERRVMSRLDEIEIMIEKMNIKIIEWIPLLNNLSKSEENKRTITISLIVIFVTNIAAWIFTAFIFFVKSGVVVK